MKSNIILILACVAILWSTAFALGQQAKQADGHAALTDSNQMLLVATADWNAVAGTMQRYERSAAHSKWKTVGAPITIVVGKNGLGWGVGLMPPISPKTSDPIKKEGDGKAPAGVFALLSTFGYAAQAPVGWKMPYIPLGPSMECVDDTHSHFYNQVIDRNTVTVDWNSSEQMRRPDDLYTWGVVVGHNSNPPVAGDGSCIFMHIWKAEGTGTVGCTAMTPEHIEALLAWLDPSKKPVLVQLPMAQYREFKKRWKLPALPPSK